MTDANIYNRDRIAQAQRDALDEPDYERERQLWLRLTALDYLSWALGSGREPELVEALFGPASLPSTPRYEDEDEPESPGEREADPRIKTLRDKVERQYRELGESK